MTVFERSKELGHNLSREKLMDIGRDVAGEFKHQSGATRKSIQVQERGKSYVVWDYSPEFLPTIDHFISEAVKPRLKRKRVTAVKITKS